jgi:hypothetical protein
MGTGTRKMVDDLGTEADRRTCVPLTELSIQENEHGVNLRLENVAVIGLTRRRSYRPKGAEAHASHFSEHRKNVLELVYPKCSARYVGFDQPAGRFLLRESIFEYASRYRGSVGASWITSASSIARQRPS